MKLLGAAIGTYRPQYRPLSAIRYLDANPLPTHYPVFFTVLTSHSPWYTENKYNVLTDESSREVTQALAAKDEL